MSISPTLRARFEAGCGPREPCGCIPWTRARTKDGYGMISVSTEIGAKGAHVVAWFLRHGVWPELVRHDCDNKGCVNVEHMQDGTHAENHADAFERGLRLSGEKHWFAKLTNVQADEIRRRAVRERVVDLAKEFGVHVDTISRIKHGHSRRYA